MAYDVDKLKAENPIEQIAARYTVLTKNGDELEGLCPFHKEKTPSFRVIPHKRFAHCFGCGWNGDSIQFTADIHGVDFKGACEILAGDRVKPAAMAPAPEREEGPDIYGELEPLPPPPPEHWPRAGHWLRCWNPKRASVKPWTHYKPSMVFPYLTAEGALIGCVLRIDLSEGRKITPTIRYVRLRDGTAAWSHMPFDKPRPLYRLERLAGALGEVYWAEGEKSADAVTSLIGSVCVASPGGGKAVSHVDYSPLAGRDVVIWGDQDDEGERAILGYEHRGTAHPGVCELISKAGARRVRYIARDRAKPKGWDAADAKVENWTGHQTHSWIRPLLKDWTPDAKPTSAKKSETAPEAVKERRPDEPIAVPTGPAPRAPSDHPFRILGYDRGVFYYMPHGSQQIMELTAAKHTRKFLLQLAPLAYWAAWHAHKTREFNEDRVTNDLIRACERVGLFDVERLRGRGAWIDNGRPVIHAGDQVIIAGKTHPPAAAPSRYIYQRGQALHLQDAEAAGDIAAKKLPALCERMSWEQQVSGRLLAGWIMIAAVCGALEWRPHCWIRGPATSGKTTVVDGIVAPMLGVLALRRDGNTTEAHLRQEMDHDARPIIIDEAEREGKAAAERMENVLQLSRISASGGQVGKGGQDGRAVTYTVRSAFLFSSINPSVTHYADETRITQLALARYEGPDPEAHFASLNGDIAATITPEYAAAMFRRTVDNLPTLLTNIKIITGVASAIIKNHRGAKQIGAMLAGYYLCQSTAIISSAEAEALVRQNSWAEFTASDGAPDDKRLLQTIATHVRRIAGAHGIREYTIGELILIASQRKIMDGLSSSDAKTELGRLGIRIEDKSYFAIANRSNALSRILADTPWSANWRGTLRQIKSAMAVDRRYFSPGFKERATALAIDELEEEKENHAEAAE